MRIAKPWERAPDPRDDPSVVEMEDGSLFQHDHATGKWTRLSGPRVEQESHRSRRQNTDVDWGMVFYGVLFLLALYGLVNLALGLYGHAIYCHFGTSQGCYFYMPPHAAQEPPGGR